MHTFYGMLHLPLKGEKYFMCLYVHKKSSGRIHYTLTKVAERASQGKGEKQVSKKFKKLVGKNKDKGRDTKGSQEGLYENMNLEVLVISMLKPQIDSTHLNRSPGHLTSCVYGGE